MATKEAVAQLTALPERVGGERASHGSLKGLMGTAALKHAGEAGRQPAR